MTLEPSIASQTGAPGYPDIALVRLDGPAQGASWLPLATASDMAYFSGQRISVFGYGPLTQEGRGRSDHRQEPSGSLDALKLSGSHHGCSDLLQLCWLISEWDHYRWRQRRALGRVAERRLAHPGCRLRPLLRRLDQVLHLAGRDESSNASGCRVDFFHDGSAAAAPTASHADTSCGQGLQRRFGVYWRRTPNWNDPIDNPGYGVYTGDRVQLNCWVRGGTVPPYYNNPLWYQATVMAGRGKGSGLVNDHFLDTGINVPNIIVPGVPPCGSTPPPGPPTISNFDDCPDNYTSPISTDPDTGAEQVCLLNFGTQLQVAPGIACSATLTNGAGLTASLTLTDSLGTQVSVGPYELSGSPRSIFVDQTYIGTPWMGEAPFGTYKCDLSLGAQHVTKTFIERRLRRHGPRRLAAGTHMDDYKNAGGQKGQQ